MKIYDCFIMLNELDLLELRLNELNSAVDFFVIVESNKTFSFKDKPFYFDENKDRFKEFLHKIIYVPVTDLPYDPNRWEAEYYQRNAIMRGIKDAHPEDLIIISDIDEIWNKKKLEIEGFPYTFEQMTFKGYLNTIQIDSTWYGSVVLLRRMLVDHESPQYWRNAKNQLRRVRGGWHFSYCGGPEQIRYKLESFSHAEYDNENSKKYFINNANLHVTIMPINEEFPDYLRLNQEQFKEMIHA